jgi:thiosulfate/3-mercaptopyruvate sulfurtransferase
LTSHNEEQKEEVMKSLRYNLVTLFLLALLASLFTGCGSNSGGETTAAPPQTGDTTLFPNAALFVSPADLATSSAIVLDARSADDYKVEHIPGAISAPPTLFEADGVLKSKDELAFELGKLGVTCTSEIILYDNTIASRGAAGRLFWILEYLGCSDVTVLNGGWDQWKENYPSSGTPDPTTLPAAEFTVDINPNVKHMSKEDVA